MFNAVEIVRKNNETFYDFDTGRPRSQIPRIATTCVAALLAAIFISEITNNLLAGFLAVQSILLGFTFNVMFFLISNRDSRFEIKSEIPIEQKLRVEKNNRIYHELFYNVSYFNIISIISIIITIILLLPSPKIPFFLDYFYDKSKYIDTVLYTSILNAIKIFVTTALLSVFYAIVIEVLYTISRLAGRTSFYFSRKVSEMRDDRINNLQ